MMTIDCTSLAIGLATGAVASALFFAGLGWGMRLALRTNNPVAVLLPSAALRIALLLGVGWWVTRHGVAAAAGFALAFLALRVALVAVLREPKEGASWN